MPWRGAHSLIKHHIMKTYWGVEVNHAFLISVLDGDKWSASRPGRFTCGTYQIGGWVGPRLGEINSVNCYISYMVNFMYSRFWEMSYISRGYYLRMMCHVDCTRIFIRRCGIVYKCKGEVVPVVFFLLIEHHALKAYWGTGGIASRILDLGTRWRWVISFTARPLYPPG
jgi:hypothetical protein